MKNMMYERKVNRREELHQIFDAARRVNDPDDLREVKINLNFICSSITVENRAHIHMPFVTEYDLGSKIQKY
jgi:hypothetical protein